MASAKASGSNGIAVVVLQKMAMSLQQQRADDFGQISRSCA